LSANNNVLNAKQCYQFGQDKHKGTLNTHLTKFQIFSYKHNYDKTGNGNCKKVASSQQQLLLFMTMLHLTFC